LRELKETLAVRISRTMDIDGFQIQVDPFDGPGHVFWRTGLTEPETRRVLAGIIKPGMVMLDIGAYVGQFTLVASRVAGDQLKILAIEPTPAVYKQLCRNVAANRCSGVTCIQRALSDKPGSARFYFYPDSYDQNSLRPLSDESARFIDVEVETIDSLSEQHRLSRIDLIKVDVEGNELAVLKGARRVLAEKKPALIVEVSRHQHSYGYCGIELNAFLRDIGYDVFRIGPESETPYQPSRDEINPSVSHFNVLAKPRPH